MVAKLVTDEIDESTMHLITTVMGTRLLIYPWLVSAMARLMNDVIAEAEF
jgi:hypothetical protein